jgi:hypothetical protein
MASSCLRINLSGRRALLVFTLTIAASRFGDEKYVKGAEIINRKVQFSGIVGWLFYSYDPDFGNTYTVTMNERIIFFLSQCFSTTFDAATQFQSTVAQEAVVFYKVVCSKLLGSDYKDSLAFARFLLMQIRSSTENLMVKI